MRMIMMAVVVEQERPMRTASITLALLLRTATGYAAENAEHEKMETEEAAKNAPALAAVLKEAKVSLANGIKASEKEGKPISGKFELEDGKLQLSVYTMKGVLLSSAARRTATLTSTVS